MNPIRWSIWIGFVVFWTLVLLRPVPEPLILTTESIAPGRRWFVAKVVHLTGFAILAVLSGWLRVPQRMRLPLLWAIMAHCTATELLQGLLTYRDGNMIDIGINNLGILAGMTLSWKWWAEKDA